MSAAWAAIIVSVIVGLAAVGREILQSGQHAGKVDACLVQLTALTTDHEVRLRNLEDRRTELRKFPNSADMT